MVPQPFLPGIAKPSGYSTSPPQPTLPMHILRTEGTRGTTVPGRAIKATRLSNRLQPRATRSLRASLVHSLDQSPVHGGTVNKELLRTVTNTTRAAQQGAWATRFDLPPAPQCASGAFGMDTTRRHTEQLSVNGNFSVLMRHPDGATGFAWIGSPFAMCSTRGTTPLLASSCRR